VLRGSAMYWFLYLLFRCVLRRDVGSIAIADVLLLVLIADASQNAMSGGYSTVAEGFVLVATIAGWSYLLDWAAFRFEPIRRLIEPGPLMLVRNGRVLRHNLRQELMSLDELYAKLRQEGVEDVARVKSAFMESDGRISVIQLPHGAVPSSPSRPTQ
jgi:uncharacterized membrane protein YcaP (DUF421 family)